MVNGRVGYRPFKIGSFPGLDRPLARSGRLNFLRIAAIRGKSLPSLGHSDFRHPISGFLIFVLPAVSIASRSQIRLALLIEV